jgi:hypothetical protein
MTAVIQAERGKGNVQSPQCRETCIKRFLGADFPPPSSSVPSILTTVSSVMVLTTKNVWHLKAREKTLEKRAPTRISNCNPFVAPADACCRFSLLPPQNPSFFSLLTQTKSCLVRVSKSFVRSFRECIHTHSSCSQREKERRKERMGPGA